MHHTPLVPGLVHRRILEVRWGHGVWLLGPTRLAGPWRGDRLAVGLQNRWLVSRVLVGDQQVHHASTCAPVHIFDQLFRLRGGALARHHAHHQTMYGVEGDMIPIIALFGVRWIVGIAVSLFFPYECPLLVTLDLSRLRGKRDQDIM